MSELIYGLCAISSGICSFLLLRSFKKNRTQLLLWIAVGFLGLAIHNVLLFIDLVITGPETDLSVLRNGVGVVAMGLLLYGLIWEEV